jgi:hypothetical protein
VVEQSRSYKLDEDEASVPAPAGVVDVEASGTEGETVLDVVQLPVLLPVVVDVVSCAGVEVEETNGGAFWTYDPLGSIDHRLACRIDFGRSYGPRSYLLAWELARWACRGCRRCWDRQEPPL